MKKLQSYLEGFLAFLIFGVGNIVNLIWKKHMNKVFWSMLACLWSYNFWRWYQDPVGTWEIIQRNSQNPWYWIPLGLIALIPFVFIYIVVKHKREVKQVNKVIDRMKKSLLKSAEETDLMRSGKTPTNEDIDKYYKMYLIKFEEDNKDRWNTEEPMPFDHWEKCARDDFDFDFGKVGWKFMISMTSDMFSFDPYTGQSTMYRFRDYDEMLEQNDYKDLINKQLDIE